jgi:hypothetical protein
VILKNVASQGVYLFASNKTTGVGLAGDQANITGTVSKDGGAEAAFGTTNPTNIGGGLYWQPLTQAETNADAVAFRWVSSTSNILIDPVIGFTERGLVQDLPTTAEFNARTLPSADYFDPATDAVANVTTVGSVTGNVGGNVAGSVGSVTSPVTAGTVTDKTGYSLTQAFPTNFTSLVISSGGVVEANVVAVDPALETPLGDVADAVLDEVVEGSRTLRQYLRGFAAALLAKASGLGTTTAVYRDTADSKNRISATVDADGNRSAVTLDLD